MTWLQENLNVTWALLGDEDGDGDGDDAATYDWIHTLATMRRYGMNNIFVEESVAAKNLLEPSKKILHLKKPKFVAIKEF